MKTKEIITLGGYSSIHGIIDLSCAAVVLSTLSVHGISNVFIFIVIYNILAFGLQAPFGYFVDKFQVPKESALIGCIIVLSAFFFIDNPALVAILSGIGNAFFHVGGGSISLNFSPKRATAPGIFVAPGALGLTIGILIGKSGAFVSRPFIILLLASCLFIITTKPPIINYITEKKSQEIKYFWIIIMLLLLSVSIRSLYGLTAAWKSDTLLLFMLTFAIVLGKALGGIIADRFGWMKTAIIALTLSAPLLAFFPETPFLAILGAFLFQMTMPITLTALSNMMPGRSATAFGLTVLALILGVVPTYLGFNAFLSNQWIVLIIICISLISLGISFKFLYHHFKYKLKITM